MCKRFIDVTRDYPRWRMIRDGKNNNLEEVSIIKLTLLYMMKIGMNLMDSWDFNPLCELYVEKSYNGDLKAKFLTSEEEWIKSLLNSPIIDEDIEKEISS